MPLKHFSAFVFICSDHLLLLHSNHIIRSKDFLTFFKCVPNHSKSISNDIIKFSSFYSNENMRFSNILIKQVITAIESSVANYFYTKGSSSCCSGTNSILTNIKCQFVARIISIKVNYK